MLSLALESGYRLDSRWAMARISVWADANGTPGRKRPTTPGQLWPLREAVSGERSAGIQMSPLAGSAAPGGSTPTMVAATPSRRTACPSTAGLAPNSRRQSASLITASGACAVDEKLRPSAGLTPKIRKNFRVADVHSTRIGSLAPSNVPGPPLYAASAVKLVACRCQSWKSSQDVAKVTPVRRELVASATSRSGCAYGSGRSTVARVPNSAVLA